MTNEAYPWLFVTQILRKDFSSHGEHNIFEVMTSTNF